MASTNKINCNRMNHVIAKLSVEIHMLSTSLNYGKNSELIILDCLERILSLITMIKEPYEIINKHASEFDCCPEIPQNGFRSLCYLADKCIGLTFTTIDRFKLRRKSYFVNYVRYEQRFQNIRDLLCSVYFMLKFGEKIAINKTTNSENYDTQGIDISNSLFVDINDPINKLMYESDLFTDRAFYGDLLGFYYKDSVRMPLNNIANAMAGFSDALDKTSNKFGRALTTLAFSSIYSNNREKRSQRLKALLTNPSVEFIKSFWSLSEDYKLTVFTDLINPSIAVDKSFHIPTDDNIIVECTNVNGGIFELTPPPNKPFINARLYSSNFRVGQKSLKDFSKYKYDGPIQQDLEPNSDYILFHCPGGGFLAQTPKSHSVYLKIWAKNLNLPIISIDYSKAPQSPFPSAVEECFYAYCWMLKNYNALGTNATKIGIVGDSAGGNLIYGVVNKAIEAGIRIPDFVVAVYPVLCLLPTITPSRILSTCDILLSVEVLKLCLVSYISDNRPDQIERILGESATAKQLNKIKKNHSSSSSVQTVNRTNDCSRAESDKTLNQREKSISSSIDIGYCNNLKSKPKNVQKYHIRMNESFIKNEYINNNFINSDNTNTYNLGRSQSFGYSESNMTLSDTEMHDLLEKNGWTKYKQNISTHHYISPLFTPEHLLKKFPKSYIILSNMDPLLDDSIEFTKKLKKYGAPVDLHVVEGLPHGFLQLSFVSSDASNANETIINIIKSEFSHNHK